MSGFIGRVTSAATLKTALDVSSQRTRVVADRVARASLQQPNGGFALPETNAPAGSAHDPRYRRRQLADEQLRYEATAKLLQRAYQSVRTSMRER